MAKRRTISYKMTATLAVVFGSVAVAAAVTDLVARATDTDLGALGTPMAIVGITLWFLGTAMSVLAISTEYKKASIAGLILAGIAILIFMLAPMLIA